MWSGDAQPGAKDGAVAISTRVDTEKRVRVHTVTGPLFLDELMGTLKGIYSSEDFDPAFDVLWDIRDADVSSFSHEEIVRLRDLVTGHWGVEGGSRAALIVSEDLSYGLARMYGSLIESSSASELRVFRNMEDALNWLQR